MPALARSLFFLGRFDDALDVLRQQELRLQDVGDPALAGPVLFWLGYFEDLVGDHAAAVPRLERAIEEGARAHDAVTTGQAHYELARGSFWSGRPREGLAHGEAAVALLEATDQRWWLGIAHWVVGINQGLLGGFESALAAEARAGAVGEAIEDRSLQGYAAFTSGWILAMRGEGEAAIAACRRALELSSDPVTRAQALGLLGYGYLEMGDAPSAIQFLEQSLEPVAQARPSHAWFSILLGEAYLAGGDLDRARTLLTRGLAVATDVAYPLGWGSRCVPPRPDRSGGRSVLRRPDAADGLARGAGVDGGAIRDGSHAARARGAVAPRGGS